jgi:hypothetical protein
MSPEVLCECLSGAALSVDAELREFPAVRSCLLRTSAILWLCGVFQCSHHQMRCLVSCVPQVRSGEDRSGTTAVFGFVTPTHIIIANIGACCCCTVLTWFEVTHAR